MRVTNWPTRLAEYIDENRSLPFNWQTHHCCQFVAGAVFVVTGQHVQDRGTAAFDGPLDAARAMPDGLQAELTRLLGEPVQVSFARRGDVVLRPNDESHASLGPVAGVCDGEWSWFVGESGLIRARTLDCVAAWKVD